MNDRDGEDERMNPYHWECVKHGSGYGPIDECPICLKQSMEEDAANEFNWVPNLCGDCASFDINNRMCNHYGFWTPKFEKKTRKKCKWKVIYDPSKEEMMDDWEYAQSYEGRGGI